MISFRPIFCRSPVLCKYLPHNDLHETQLGNMNVLEGFLIIYLCCKFILLISLKKRILDEYFMTHAVWVALKTTTYAKPN